MRLTEVCQETFQELEEGAEISRLKIDKARWCNYLHTIDTINDCAYLKKNIIVDDEVQPLQDYLVPDALKELIYPSKLSLAHGDNFVDVMVRPKDIEAFVSLSGYEVDANKDDKSNEAAVTISYKVLDPRVFNLTSKAIVGSRRKSEAPMVDVASLRIETILTDKVDVVYMPGNTCADGGKTGFRPLPVKYEFREQLMANADPKNVLVRWFSSKMGSI